MAKTIGTNIRVQHLILTTAGQKPTIPSPVNITPEDSRWKQATDILKGEWAYNVEDDIWFYRKKDDTIVSFNQTVQGEGILFWTTDVSDNQQISAGQSVNFNSILYFCKTTHNVGSPKAFDVSKFDREGDDKVDKVSSATQDNITVFDSGGNIKDSGIPISNVGGGSGSGYENTYTSVPAMITGQGDQNSGSVQFVSDASKDFPGVSQGDPTVETSGSWAEYVYLGTTNGDLTDYRKKAEEESIDIDLSNKADKVDLQSVSIVAGTPDTLTLDIESKREKIYTYVASADHDIVLQNITNLNIAHIHAKLSNTVVIGFQLPTNTFIIATEDQPIGVTWDDVNDQLTIEATTDDRFELSITRVLDGTDNYLKLEIGGPYV